MNVATYSQLDPAIGKLAGRLQRSKQIGFVPSVTVLTTDDAEFDRLVAEIQRKDGVTERFMRGGFVVWSLVMIYPFLNYMAFLVWGHR